MGSSSCNRLNCFLPNLLRYLKSASAPYGKHNHMLKCYHFQNSFSFNFFFFNFQVFKEHSIDGSTLALLTDDHLTKRLGMKLGPALKLRSVIMKKLGPKSGGLCVHCAHCHALMQAASAEQRRPAE